MALLTPCAARRKMELVARHHSRGFRRVRRRWCRPGCASVFRSSRRMSWKPQASQSAERLEARVPPTWPGSCWVPCASAPGGGAGRQDDSRCAQLAAIRQGECLARYVGRLSAAAGHRLYRVTIQRTTQPFGDSLITNFICLSARVWP